MAIEQFHIRDRWTNAIRLTAEIECDPNAPTSIKLGLAIRWAVKSKANLAGANLARAYLAGAYLAGADLAGANLAGADLAGAYLAKAYLAKANLAGADLAKAYLAKAYLAKANLAGANLARAYLAGAYLAGADLAGANLAGAYLAKANLAGADLAGAYLAGADLAGAKIIRILAIAARLDGHVFHAFEMDGLGVMIQAGCRWLSPADYRAHVAKEYPDTNKAIETLSIIDHIERMAALYATKPEASQSQAEAVAS